MGQGTRILTVNGYSKFGNFREGFIFAKLGVLFSRNFAYAKFRENKTPKDWGNHSLVY